MTASIHTSAARSCDQMEDIHHYEGPTQHPSLTAGQVPNWRKLTVKFARKLS